MIYSVDFYEEYSYYCVNFSLITMDPEKTIEIVSGFIENFFGFVVGLIGEMIASSPELLSTSK